MTRVVKKKVGIHIKQSAALVSKQKASHGKAVTEIPSNAAMIKVKVKKK